jgi:hypothetical protein
MEECKAGRMERWCVGCIYDLAQEAIKTQSAKHKLFIRVH